MTPRAAFIYWSLAENEPERVLDDLARWTRINTVIVASSYAKVDDPREASPFDRVFGTRYVLRSAAAFGNLPVPTVTAEEFDSLLRFADLAKARGFNVASHVLPINPISRGLLPLSCIDVTGARAVDEDIVAQGCPNNPDTLRFAETLVREVVASWTSIDMLDLNHMEYPRWPHVGLKELFVCFCEFCEKKAEAQGIDFRQMKREVSALYSSLTTAAPAGPESLPAVSGAGLVNFLLKRPLLAAWLNFRTSSMTGLIARVAKAAREAAKEHNPDLQIGLDVHLPSTCHLLGTDFNELHPLLDWISPKFPDYVPGYVIPLIAEEIASKTGRWSAPELMELLRELHDLGPGPQEYRPANDPNDSMLYSSNVFDSPDVIRRQMKYLDPLLGKVPVYPLVFIPDRDMGHLTKKFDALRQHGFDGYLVWGWENDLTTEALKESEGIF